MKNVMGIIQDITTSTVQVQDTNKQLMTNVQMKPHRILNLAVVIL